MRKSWNPRRLAGLTVGMFHDETTGKEVPCPDTQAGLHVRTSDGVVRVVAEPDHLLFQAGEVLQIVSGGMLRATSHCVVPPKVLPELSRSVFVVFCQPKCDSTVHLMPSLDNRIGLPPLTHCMQD
jgi:isopenicillin N synthase-like dioxygenase